MHEVKGQPTGANQSHAFFTRVAVQAGIKLIPAFLCKLGKEPSFLPAQVMCEKSSMNGCVR